MTDNDTNLDALPGMQGTNPKPRNRSHAFWILALVLLAIAGGVFAFKYYGMRVAGTSDSGAFPIEPQMQQRLDALESNVQNLNQRVAALSNAPASANAGEAPNATAKQSANDIARLQSDMVALSSALSALQNQVKEASNHAEHSQQMAQDAVASAIAYIQLRAVAMTDQPFMAELDALRDASPNDPEFQQALNDLQPVASSGAPTAAELHDELLTLEPGADHAASRAQAQNIWDRLLAEIKGLVSVRRLHGGGDSYLQIETDLAKNDLPAALEHIKTLPSGAQDVLKDLRGEIEARQTITVALRRLADRFSAGAQTHAAPAAE